MKSLHTITVLCAYCKKLIGRKEGDGVSGTSHGICASCLTLAKDLAAEWNERDKRPHLCHHAASS
ncbi:MAG: hypothetical protein HY360_09520 [Verrucomicrobia bacterium]|nr:hypothetical protein [Verrucomicrobiota bacterium]